MHSYDAKGSEDVHRHHDASNFTFRGMDANIHQRNVISQNRYNLQKDHDFTPASQIHKSGLPQPSVLSRPLVKSKSEVILQGGPRQRHVTFQQHDQRFVGEATGLPSGRSFQPKMVLHKEEIGIPTAGSHNRWNQSQNKTKDRVASESEEEYFVDGNFFFNHLVRHKEAEDYNMAEMLRERSRELQRRNVLGTRLPHQNSSSTDIALANSDRLSRSLPLDAYVSKRYYYSNNPEIQRVPLHPVREEIPFAGGLEVEIPPRRHAGLGGGGLRQSMSEDRLLMVPSSHRQSAFFGKHYFKMAGNSSNPQNLTSRIPSSYSATDFVPRSYHQHSPNSQCAGIQSNNEMPPATKGFDFRSSNAALLIPGIEPITNRYNVRTGRLEPSPDFALKNPSILYNRQETSSSDFTHTKAELNLKPSSSNLSVLTSAERPRYNTQRVRTVSSGSITNVNLPVNDWDVSHSRHLSPVPQQPKKIPSQSYITDHGRSYTVSPHENSTIVSRKVVTWQDRVSPSHLMTSNPSPVNYAEEQTSYRQYETKSPCPGDLAGTSFPLSDSLARNFVISDLHDVDQFALFEVSTSKLAWGEGFMGSDWLDKAKQYKFVVLNRNEEVLFVGVEDESSLSDCISSPHKSSFSVRILDANGRDVVHFRRLYSIKSKASFSTGNKTKYRLEVATPEGHVIGNVEKTYDSDNYYILEDRTGEFMFLVQRSCICTCPLFWDYEFKILLPESGTEIGEISWSYLTAQNEHFHGTEISFPLELNTISKVMLLGVCFLLNFSRWQSAYLDAIYNPWKHKENYKLCPWRTLSSENKELAALLRSSPDVDGFQRNEVDVVDEDIELEASPSRGIPSSSSTSIEIMTRVTQIIKLKSIHGNSNELTLIS